MVCPRPSPRGLLAPSPGLRGPTWSPAQNSLPRPELRPRIRGPGPLLGTPGFGDAHHHLLHQPTPSPALSRSASSSKTPPTQLELVVAPGVLSAPAVTSVRDHLLPCRGPRCGEGVHPAGHWSAAQGWEEGPGKDAGRHLSTGPALTPHPPASRQMEKLPSPHLLPCPPTTSPDPED